MTDPQLIHLIYISSATQRPTDPWLDALLLQSRARNLRQGITGMLVCHEATFVQVLEGAPRDVQQIFADIRIDPRNEGVVKLIEEPISQRDFPDWTMGFARLSRLQHAELPGFVDLFDGTVEALVARAGRPPGAAGAWRAAGCGRALRPDRAPSGPPPGRGRFVHRI